MIIAAARPAAGAGEGLGRIVLASRARGFLARLGCERSRGVAIDVHEAGSVRRDRTGELTLLWPDVVAVYELLEEVETPIGTRLEPKIVLEAAFGRRVELGPIAVDGYGMHAPDATHAWAAIAFVRRERVIYRGSFSIHLLDGSIGARVPSEYVANPRVLLALLERHGKLETAKETVIARVLGAA